VACTLGKAVVAAMLFRWPACSVRLSSQSGGRSVPGSCGKFRKTTLYGGEVFLHASDSETLKRILGSRAGDVRARVSLISSLISIYIEGTQLSQNGRQKWLNYHKMGVKTLGDYHKKGVTITICIDL
jgi:hypothetical protein